MTLKSTIEVCSEYEGEHFFYFVEFKKKGEIEWKVRDFTIICDVAIKRQRRLISEFKALELDVDSRIRQVHMTVRIDPHLEKKEEVIYEQA